VIAYLGVSFEEDSIPIQDPIPPDLLCFNGEVND
jgi:hypothetical protein